MLTLSSLGSTLTDALDDLIGAERMDPQLAMKVLMQFDRVITEALSEKVKARLTFKVNNILPSRILHDPRTYSSFGPTVTHRWSLLCQDRHVHPGQKYGSNTFTYPSRSRILDQL